MLKTPEVADRLGVSEDTIKRWRRRTIRENRQIGPPFMKSETGIVFYPEDELERWIKQKMVVVA